MSDDWDAEVVRQEQSKRVVKDKTGDTINHEPATIADGGMATPGLKTVYDFIDAPLGNRATVNKEETLRTNKQLKEDITDLVEQVKNLDANKVKAAEGNLDDIEEDYLKNLKDVKKRMNTIQNETSKLKMEYLNNSDRL